MLTLPTFLDDAMPAAFYRLLPSLRDCRGFVIDLRGNGGGHSDNADAFAQAFRSGPFPIAQVRHPVHIGACKAFGTGLPPGALDPRDPRQKQILDVCRHTLFEEELETVSRPDCPLTLTRPAVVLTDAGTASSSENLLLALEGRAAVVGTPSAGSTGNPLPVPLPGGGAARICTRRYAHADGRPFTISASARTSPPGRSPTTCAAASTACWRADSRPCANVSERPGTKHAPSCFHRRVRFA